MPVDFPRPVALTRFAGRAGDHNDRAMAGSATLAEALARRLDVAPVVVGHPEPPLDAAWDVELATALPALRELQARYEAVHDVGQVPITALSRCAVALATLPVVARRHPDAVVVWFDAHADVHTPATTTTGYLGGLALSGPAGLWDTGLGAGLDPARAVLVGARDVDPPERRLLDDGVFRLVPVGPDLASTLAAAVGDAPVYVHVDCDVLEPGVVPTDYRVPGGLSLDDLRDAADVLARNVVVGLEVGEYEAVPDGGAPHDPTALVDALAPLLDAARRPVP